MSLWQKLFGSKDAASSPLETHTSTPASKQPDDLRPLEQLLGTLLETWDQRYGFSLDREKWELVLSVPGFELLATEAGEGKIALSFEEAGNRHRVAGPLEEAPRLIEALLFPDPE